MSIGPILRRYVNDLLRALAAASATGEYTDELSYRPALDRFFGELMALLAPTADKVFEPKRQARAGRPDWRFHDKDTLGVYGYVEAKGLDPREPMRTDPHRKQIERYLSLGNKLIVTDGVDFDFFSPDSTEPRRLSLIAKPIEIAMRGEAGADALLEAKFETEFRSFFSQTGFRTCSETRLIQEVAKRAAALSDSITELAGLREREALDERERKTIRVLRRLKSLLQKHHDPTLKSDKVFGDFVAQVLTFGLFYAYRVVCEKDDSPAERHRKIREFWAGTLDRHTTSSLRPIRALMNILEEELGSLGPLGVWYDECCRVLAHTNLEEGSIEEPDYHALYERFLSEFDPHTQLDYGAFYTPRDLARFVVKMVQWAARTELDGASLYEEGNKLIDPCCGTGTFLEQLILNSDGKAHLPILAGLEILPAPYALAHYRMSTLPGMPRDLSNVRILLTNSLSDEVILEPRTRWSASLPDVARLIQDEQADAREVSRPPLTLVIGNLPSSDSLGSRSRGGNFREIERLLEDFRPPRSKRSSRQNTQKALWNEFVKFLRWGCERIVDSPVGIIAVLVPWSFADRPSFTYARKWMVGNLHKLWVLDIDEESRRGISTSSLFRAQQGRTLLVGIRDGRKGQPSQGEVLQGSIAHLSREDKLAELNRERSEEGYASLFVRLDVHADRFAFRPRKPFDEATYARFWPLCPTETGRESHGRFVFSRHCSGIKLAPSGLFVHVDKDILLRRCRDVAKTDRPADVLIRDWFSGQDKPPEKDKFTPSLRDEIRRAIESGEPPIRRYAYRPFLNVYALLSQSVLRAAAAAKGSGTRARPEVLAAFASEDAMGIAIAPAPEDIGTVPHPFASFCWFPPDNDLCKRQNAHVFCARFPEYRRHAGWDSVPTGNINEALLARISSFCPEEPEKAILYYTYAILSSDAFLDMFEGALFTVAGAWPRIPICDDKELFCSLAQRGKALAMLEREDCDLEIPEHIMGFERRFEQPFKLKKYDVDDDQGRLVLSGEDEHGRRVDLCVGPLREGLVSLQISGYGVVRQWLKFHSYRYTRAEFTRDRYVELLRLLARLERRMQIIDDLDDEVTALLSGKVPLL